MQNPLLIIEYVKANTDVDYDILIIGGLININ